MVLPKGPCCEPYGMTIQDPRCPYMLRSQSRGWFPWLAITSLTSMGTIVVYLLLLLPVIRSSVGQPIHFDDVFENWHSDATFWAQLQGRHVSNENAMYVVMATLLAGLFVVIAMLYCVYHPDTVPLYRCTALWAPVAVVGMGVAEVCLFACMQSCRKRQYELDEVSFGFKRYPVEFCGPCEQALFEVQDHSSIYALARTCGNGRTPADALVHYPDGSFAVMYPSLDGTECFSRYVRWNPVFTSVLLQVAMAASMVIAACFTLLPCLAIQCATARQSALPDCTLSCSS